MARKFKRWDARTPRVNGRTYVIFASESSYQSMDRLKSFKKAIVVFFLGPKLAPAYTRKESAFDNLQ